MSGPSPGGRAASPGARALASMAAVDPTSVFSDGPGVAGVTTALQSAGLGAVMVCSATG